MSSANVVDLVGSPSTSKTTTQLNSHGKISSDRKKKRRLARSARSSRNVEMITDGNVKVPPEIIDLEGDSSTPLFTRGKRNSTGRKRSRPLHFSALEIDDDDGDDDIVEIISPPSAPAAAAAGRSFSVGAAASPNHHPPNETKHRMDRIREVFPLLSRAKVDSLLAMAGSYLEEDAVFDAVASALSEDPLGTSISKASFAAMAVGGRARGRKFPMTAGERARSGRRKVAQLECQCCFAEYDFEQMVSCRTGGHLFCKVCLQKHTEQRVFGVGNLGVKPNSINGTNTKHTSKALEILCMASDCSSGFREEQLRKACSEKVLAKYNELQYAAVMESANVEGLGKCPKCNFIAIVDDGWPPLLFYCPQCKFKSCRDCGEEYHPGIRCDEVETKVETDGRRVVEEAMTSAMVRTCPRPMCRKKFLKSDGCNKMTCSCGCYVCYVCGKEIPKHVAYKHFCQV